MIFVLDDSDVRINWFQKEWLKHRVDYAKTAQEAIEKLRNTKTQYEMIFLDHDLADVHYDIPAHEIHSKEGVDGWELTGHWVAKIMAKENLHTDTPVFINTCNPDGAIAMADQLKSTHKEIKVMPFWKLVEIFAAGRLDKSEN